LGVKSTELKVAPKPPLLARGERKLERSEQEGMESRRTREWAPERPTGGWREKTGVPAPRRKKNGGEKQRMGPF